MAFVLLLFIRTDLLISSQFGFQLCEFVSVLLDALLQFLNLIFVFCDFGIGFIGRLGL